MRIPTKVFCSSPTAGWTPDVSHARTALREQKTSSVLSSLSLRFRSFRGQPLFVRRQLLRWITSNEISKPCVTSLQTSHEKSGSWSSWEVNHKVYSGPSGENRELLKTLPPPRLSVAPMMEYTDNHFRHLARLLSRHTWLYTEMVVDNTLIHQQPHLEKWLEFPICQHPVVLQLGGSDPKALGEAVRLAEAYGYDEINLNCGCPSSAVAGHGCFGARLMLDPLRVANVVASMAANCSVPITIKCRIGVDDCDSYQQLCEFVATISEQAGVEHFVIHARKALLNGLNPAQNRSVPPLRYEYVSALMRDFPHLCFTLNGGILSLLEAQNALQLGFQGVMIGRAAYSNPWRILSDADRVIYGVPNRAVSRRQVLEEYVEYADSVKGRYNPHRPSLRALIMPLINLFHGEKGGARWRRAIDVALRNSTTLKDVVRECLPSLSDDVLDAPPGHFVSDARVLEIGPLPSPPDKLRSPLEGVVDDGVFPLSLSSL